MKRTVLIFLASAALLTSILCLLGLTSQHLKEIIFPEYKVIESATAIFYLGSALALTFLIIKLKLKKSLFILPVIGLVLFIEELDAANIFVQTIEIPQTIELHHFLDFARIIIPGTISMALSVAIASAIAIIILTRKLEKNDLILLWGLGISTAIAIDLIQNRPVILTYLEELIELNASLAFLLNTIQIPLNTKHKENTANEPVA